MRYSALENTLYTNSFPKKDAISVSGLPEGEVEATDDRLATTIPRQDQRP